MNTTAAVDDWYQENSLQWSETFALFSGAASFMADFDDGSLGLAELHGFGLPSLQPGTSPANFSSDSGGLFLQSPSRQCESYHEDYGREGEQSLQADHACMQIGDSTLFGGSQAADEDSRSLSGSASLARKLPIRPADRPPERPKRTKRTRQLCTVEGCDRSFACTYDLTRHLNDVHSQGDWIYKCIEPGCGYVRPRKDKVNDHCTKRAHRGPSALFVGNGQNADELEAMTEQRRKKGKRRTVCGGCGRSADNF